MIGETILNYKLLEKSGEVPLVPQSGTAETPSQIILNQQAAI